MTRAQQLTVGVSVLLTGVVGVTVAAIIKRLHAQQSTAQLQGILDLVQKRSKDLEFANLKGANLVGANLKGANLQGANLSEADLSKANLCEANLVDANLQRVLLSGTTLPDGTTWTPRTNMLRFTYSTDPDFWNPCVELDEPPWYCGDSEE